jgi:hypothetical protein
MIDYDRAEMEAEHLLRALLGERATQRRRRCLALHLACLIAALEFGVILVGAFHAL